MRNIVVLFIFYRILYQTWAKISPLVEYKLTNWSRIVPNGLYEIPKDLEVCRVLYPSGAEVNLGNYLSESDTYGAPTTITWTADPSSYYYLIFENIDVPNQQRPTMRSMFYWMVGNIPGNKVTAGETIIPYIRPEGSRNSGIHRYLFLVYKQSEKNNYTMFKVKSQAKRWGFDVRELSIRFHSQGPVAMNFFHHRFHLTDSSSTAK